MVPIFALVFILILVFKSCLSKKGYTFNRNSKQ